MDGGGDPMIAAMTMAMPLEKLVHFPGWPWSLEQVRAMLAGADRPT